MFYHWRRCLERAKACVHGKGIKVEIADEMILKSFEEGLAGHVVMGKLQAALAEGKPQARDAMQKGSRAGSLLHGNPVSLVIAGGRA